MKYRKRSIKIVYKEAVDPKSDQENQSLCARCKKPIEKQHSCPDGTEWVRIKSGQRGGI